MQHPDQKLTEIDESEKNSRLSRPVRGTARVSASLFRGIIKIILILVFVGGGLLIGGFLHFSNSVIDTVAHPEVAVADGIVVLTGGPARIASGLELLAMKKGKKLLISGVNKATKRSDIESMNPQRKALFSCCVDLEHRALDTVGNAEETQKWVRATKYDSIILVTSARHMPRSLVEFNRQLKDVRIIPYPVAMTKPEQQTWWRNPETLRPMISEYLKFLGAKMRDHIDPGTLQTLRANVLGS